MSRKRIPLTERARERWRKSVHRDIETLLRRVKVVMVKVPVAVEQPAKEDR